MISTLVYLAAAVIAVVSIGLIIYTTRERVRVDLGASTIGRARLAGVVGILAALALALFFA